MQAPASTSSSAAAVHLRLGDLHPSLPRSTRICIVGAGPSGLSAAYALWKLGYEQVVVLEKHHTVGGMCESVRIEGRTYDLGGQVIAGESAPTIKHLAQVAKADMEDMMGHKLSFLDGKTGHYQDLEIAKDYMSMIQTTLDLQEKAAATSRAGVHAVSSLAAQTTAEFTHTSGIKELPEAVATGFTASGYGFPLQEDIPYAYVHEFIRTSMFGKICRVKGGYTGLWQGVAKLLPHVRCNTQVTRIERQIGSCQGIRVSTCNSETGEKEELEFDKIVISGTAPFAQPSTSFMTLGEQEAELFSRVQTVEYYTTVLKISGFEAKFPAGFFYFKGNVVDTKTVGHPVAMQRFYSNTDIYLFWSYGSVYINQEMITKLLIKDVEQMGGTVNNIVLQRKWTYFPHIGSEDMTCGFYDQLEALQGCNDTYYVGGLFAFELTERNAAYAMNLIATNFGTPVLVKDLMGTPIRVDLLESTREMTAMEDEFQDLPSLDSYLRFYSSHMSKVLYTWLDDNGNVSNSRTYAQLHNNANVVAHNLLTDKLNRIHDGDRVLLLYTPGLEFIDAFFGCLRANVLPVPLIPPDVSRGRSSPGDHALAKVEKVAVACGAKAILSTVSYHTSVRASSIRDTLLPSRSGRPSWPKLPWLHTDSWVSKQQRSNKEGSTIKDYYGSGEAGKCCFLQFTSGSTGDPKGVVITHGALIHNVKLMRRQYRSTSKTVLVSWLPQYHDMGLIGGLFTALVSGGTAVLLSPTTFIRKPLLWLEVMSKYGATHSAAPNFAFDLVAKKLDRVLDKGNNALEHKYELHSLKFLMVSAEPVRSSTLRRFLEALESSGLRQEVLAPGYGLAENCVFVTVAWGGGIPLAVDWQGRVCCGYVDRGNQDVDVRIVDPETCMEVNDGTEGEIWVRSPSNGAGYWGREKLSQETFHASLAGEDGKSDRFLRTGDLGRVIKGMLFVTGRIKDLIIIKGRNVYPSDIEKTVEGSSALLRPGCCAAFAAPGRALLSKGIQACDEDDVGVVVVAEVRDESRIDPELLTAHIASTVASEHGLSVASVKLIKPRTISKTSSGKIRRLDCLKQFTEDRLDSISPTIEKTRKILRLRKSRTFNGTSTAQPAAPLPPLAAAARTKEELTRFLTGILAERLGVSEQQVHPTKSFGDYGLDSSSVVWAAQKLSSFLGVHIAAIDIYTAGCVSELVNSVECLLLAGSSTTLPEPLPTRTANISPSNKKPSKAEISSFVCQMIAERTGTNMDKLSLSQSFANYGLDSVAVVWASQKLSSYLGVHVAAIDIYTAGCISELCETVDELVRKSTNSMPRQDNASLPCQVQGESTNDDDFESELVTDSQLECGMLPSLQQQVYISLLQLLGIIYMVWLLLVPAALILRQFSYSVASRSITAIVLCAPVSWLLYMAATTLFVSFGTKLLLPAVHIRTTVPLWSLNFVRWWTCYRLQDFASNRIVALHLCGTVFVNWWYRLLGAQIGSSVELETTDITDPWLLVLGDGATVGEGVTLQCHEVKAGAAQFKPVRIGRKCVIGQYSFIGMGTTLRSVSVAALGKVDGTSQHGVRCQDPNSDISLTAQDVSRVELLTYALCQAAGLYAVGLSCAISGVVGYKVFEWLGDGLNLVQAGTREGYILSSLFGMFPWAITAAIPLSIIQDPRSITDYLWYVVFQGRMFALALCISCAYIGYGVSLCCISWLLKWMLIGKLDGRSQKKKISSLGFRLWLVHRLLTITHSRFAFLLTGTEALCFYLRRLGAKIGSQVSIRGINAITDPDLLELKDGCHLGDFAKVVTSSMECIGYGRIEVGPHCVVGAQSVLMPGVCMEDGSWLGALSVATSGSKLKQGGVYLGIENPTMVYNHVSKQEDHDLDKRIIAMEPEYRKVVANLSAHIAKTSLSVKSRYFHRAGIAGKGRLVVLPGNRPQHDIFSEGKSYPVVVRHSNSLSSNDDARPDARGSSLRILKPDSKTVHESLLDLTLKTGNAFYARNIADFLTWLTSSGKVREEIVRESPHRADAVWDSLRLGDSYAQLHYYSNVPRLFKSASAPETEWYVKFRMKPLDPEYGIDEGRIAREGILPPDTGALPRRDNDDRPPSYLRDEFSRRLASKQGVDYVLQVQLRLAPDSPDERDLIIDCTRPWDEQNFPYVDLAAIHLDEVVDSEEIHFNPRNGVASLGMISATGVRESASIDHGRSVAYDIAQYVRSGAALPGAWKALLKESDVHLDIPDNHAGSTLLACPALSGCLPPNVAISATRAKQPSKTLVEGDAWTKRLVLAITCCVQPLLQIMAPIALVAISQLTALLLMSLVATWASRSKWIPQALVLVFSYTLSAFILSLASISARKVLVGARKGQDCKNKCELWGLESVKDTVWQCINSVGCKYFLDLTRGSALCTVYLRCLGACIEPTGVYMDTLYALNPDRVNIKAGSSIGREALLFGHVYEGGGTVHFGSNSVGEYAFVGTRSLMLPGSRLEDGAELRPLALAMKNELVRVYT